MNTTKSQELDVRAKIRAERAKTMTNWREQRMFPLVTTREHSVWRAESLWLPDGSICYTALVSLIHERGERSKSWKVSCVNERNNLSEEAWFLSTLTEIGAISIEVGAYLLISAHALANSDCHGMLDETVEKAYEEGDHSNSWFAECRSITKRILEIESMALYSQYSDVSELIAGDEEYRKLVADESGFMIPYVTESSTSLLDSAFGLPMCLMLETVMRGQDELNGHIKRERLAMVHALDNRAQ